MTNPISTVLDGTRHELADMTWAEYRAFPALNGSVLTHGRKSLLHLKHAWEHGRKDTDAMQFGRMVHCLLFEPSELEKRYRAWEGRRAGNDYKLFVAEAELDGAEVVRAEGQCSLASAIDAANSFLHNTRVQELISAGKAEQTILATERGMQCKGRLDWVSSSEHVLTDLKTAAEVEPELFGKSFFRYGYDIKLGLYKRWLESVTDDRWPVEVIVLESTPPHDVAVVSVPDAVLDAGVEKAMKIIGPVREAIDKNQWPGVAGDREMPLFVPYHEMIEETEEYRG